MSAQSDPRRVAAVHSQAFELLSAHPPVGVELLNLADDPDLSEVGFLAPPAGSREILAVLAQLTRLEVVQVSSAGTDWIEGHLPSHVTLCNARGARDAPVAEWILGALLATTSQILRGARATRWEHVPLVDLGSWTIVIVGMGSIGRRLADLLEPFGPEVIGVASHARDDLRGIDELPDLLPRADALVLLTPLTDATRGLIGAGELSLLHDDALVVNAARGGVIDTDALLTELQSARIRAVLDVTEPEPLPEDHPLWAAPGLLSLTPHLAGDSPAGHAAATQLAADQLARWARGESLRNVVRRGD